MASHQDNIGRVYSTTSSSSSSYSSRSNHIYNVFLSFRGSDVRYHFADWLYNELVGAGLYTFRDDDGINKGTDFESEIKRAIAESQVAVIIFSKDFASSTYCLDEVATFMERRRSREVQVLPVFFKIDPDNLKEVYTTSFKKHEEKLESLQGEELEKLKCNLPLWRKAIEEVAQITGHHVYETGYLSEFIREVVDDAKRLANLVTLDIPPHVVGKPNRFIHLNAWVRDESHKKRIALLHGAHGIGKKTIASVVSNGNYRDFDAAAFFDKVGENSEPSDGIVKLQHQLLSRLRNTRGKSSITSESEGIARIKAALKNKRVLIVLADLDHADHFFKLIPGPECLQRGSKVIVTSVKENLLGDGFCVRFHVEPLVPIQSLELFSWHAFGTPRPIQGCERRVMAALRYCCGIPLALERFATFSSSLGSDHWEGLLPDINEDPKVRNDLEASFASLKNDDKKLFLDIACFYAGMDFDHVDSVLSMYKEGGIDRLRSRHLVSVDDKNKVTINQATIDMGREIVRGKTELVEELSNICSPEDAIELFRECNGTKHIRSFILDGNEVPANAASEMEFTMEAFAGMTKLKLLKLVDIALKGDLNDFPKGLVWLCCVGVCLPRMPDDSSLKHLVVLELHNSTLELWNEGRVQHLSLFPFLQRFLQPLLIASGARLLLHYLKSVISKASLFSQRSFVLGKLKILDLSRSPLLVKTPDFTRFHVPKLERLILEDCTCLVEIDSSIGVLSSLVLFSLKRCHSLKELPALGSLVSLDISHCTSLHAMTNRRIDSLKELYADGTAMDLLWADSLGYSFSTVFPSLVKLSLRECNLSDEKIIDDLVKLQSLEDLDLSQNLFTAMPEALGAFLSLHSLSLNSCEHLEVVTKLPDGLKKLTLMHCKSLKKIDGIVRPAMTLLAEGCVNLVQVGEATRLEVMKDEDIIMMNDLKLYDLESFKASYEIEMANTCTGDIRKLQFQDQPLLFQCGTLSLFARGSKVPEGYDHQGKEGTLLAFVVQPEPGHRIIGVNLCILYKTRGKYTSHPIRVIMCLNNGGSKELLWMNDPLAYATANDEDTTMMWLSHWNLIGHIAPGDNLVIQVKPATDDVEMGEFGICLASEDEVKQPISSSEWYRKLDIDWSTYEELPGFFNISNNSHRCIMKTDYHYGGVYFGNLQESDILN